MRIDFHTHAFHPRVAARAVAAINESCGIQCEGTGQLTDLENDEEKAGLNRHVVLCAALSPSDVIPCNNFAIKVRCDDSRAVAFGTLHPGCANWEKELDRLARNGIRGLRNCGKVTLGFSLVQTGLSSQVYRDKT